MSEQNQGLAPRPVATGVLATYEGTDAKDKRGKEGLDGTDLKLAFLAIAQKTSAVVDPTSGGKYIEGINFFDLYNSETKAVYGKGPISFLPLRIRKRADMKGPDGKLLRENVDWNDQRVTWEGARAKGLKKPEGVRIYDVVALILPSYELVVISFMSKSFGAGQSIATWVQTRSGPAFGGKYTLSVFVDKNDAGSFGMFQVRPAGKPTAEEFEFAESAYQMVAGRNIVTEDQHADDEPGSHDGPAPVDGEVVERKAPENTPF